MKRLITGAGSAVLILLLTGGSLAARQNGVATVADTVMRGDTAALRALLNENADVNAAQVDGSTGLHWAVYKNDLDAAELLIDAGARVSTLTREGISPLYMASLYGNPQMIEELLAAGADANESGPNGVSPLMLASRNGNPEAIAVLLSAGAETEARESIRGTTALMWAVDEQHSEAVRALLEGGADYGATSGGAGLPRNYVSNRVDLDNVQEALERLRLAKATGVSPEELRRAEEASEVGSDLDTVATFIVERARAEGADPEEFLDDVEDEIGDLGVSGFLLNARVRELAAEEDVEDLASASDDDEGEPEGPVAGLVGTGGGGLTPLVFAARGGDLASARLLVEAGADVNQVTEYGWSALLTATTNRHYQLGAYLIEQGADPNIANKGGMTPLYLATDNRNIENGDYPVPASDMDHLEFIRILLDNGADPNARVQENTETRTIFTMQWLFEPGATAFVRASQSGDTALMRLLLDHGADPLIVTDYGDTALSTAAGIGWVEGVTFEWSEEENVEAIRMLLDLGLDPNSRNRDGRTPLMGAALKGRNEVVQLLVGAGALLETRDNGSRDTDKAGSKLAGHSWQAIDYSEGLVRVGVQSAISRPETATLIRELMIERGLPVPDVNRTVDSICIVVICLDEDSSLQ